MATIREITEYLFTRKRAYQLTFQVGGELPQPANVEVMADLAKFCRANESCVIPGDHDRSLLLAGRHEVWLRITQHLGLSPEQLAALYSGNAPQPK